MHDEDRPHDRSACASQTLPGDLPGDLARLLREIETEPVPGRLLDLALQLQAALVERRRADGGPEPDGA